MDDLFGSPANEAPAADDGLDDLFGNSSSEPAETTPASAPANQSPSSHSIDDLFGMPKESAPTHAIDDLFGDMEVPVEAVEESFEELPAPIDSVQPQAVQVVSSATPMFKSLADTRDRTWIDNTGKYHTQGRLIEINEDNIRLLKSNGRTCTVPKSRMSDADAAYVDSIQRRIDSSRIAMLTSK